MSVLYLDHSNPQPPAYKRAGKILHEHSFGNGVNFTIKRQVDGYYAGYIAIPVKFIKDYVVKQYRNWNVIEFEDYTDLSYQQIVSFEYSDWVVPAQYQRCIELGFASRHLQAMGETEKRQLQYIADCISGLWRHLVKEGYILELPVKMPEYVVLSNEFLALTESAMQTTIKIKGDYEDYPKPYVAVVEIVYRLREHALSYEIRDTSEGESAVYSMGSIFPELPDPITALESHIALYSQHAGEFEGLYRGFAHKSLARALQLLVDQLKELGYASNA